MEQTQITRVPRPLLMVHSDFIAVHRSTSADASLLQQLCALRIFVHVAWVATQKTSIGRRRPMHSDRSLNAPLETHSRASSAKTCLTSRFRLVSEKQFNMYYGVVECLTHVRQAV